MLGPYSNNDKTHATLGFKWNSQEFSEVGDHEGVTLLVFVAADETVAFFTDYPRDKGDFSNLTGQCFDRANARFEQVANPPKGHSGLFPIK